jgi:hypothetical protein
LYGIEEIFTWAFARGFEKRGQRHGVNERKLRLPVTERKVSIVAVEDSPWGELIEAL